MYVESLKLENIRVYEKKKFNFTQGLNVIIGRNGSGKTTAIESIALFAFGSFASIKNDFWAVKSDQSVGRVEIALENTSASVALADGKKIIKLKDQMVPLSELIGLAKVIFFNPETIDLVKGSPEKRRRELDQLLCFKDKAFVRTLLEYRKIIKNRNNLLRLIRIHNSDPSQLDFWDAKLSAKAVLIFKERQELIRSINAGLAKTHAGLLDSQSNLALKYQTNSNYDRFLENLEYTRPRDLALMSTSAGPHRDDFSFHLEDFDLSKGASRGEQRMATIAFKIESKKYLEDFKPIILLDDVFSELDERRKDSIKKIIDEGQVIITSTHESAVPKDLMKNANIINL